MISFIGEYTCKLDAKGRLLFPAGFKKQLSGSDTEHFIVKKDIFSDCLVLYTAQEWERQNKIIRKKINPYNREHTMFLRRFFKGAAEVVLDSSNRILIPRRLLDEIGAEKDITLAGQSSKIEIWSTSKYESMDYTDDQYTAMAEDIFSGLVDDLDE